MGAQAGWRSLRSSLALKLFLLLIATITATFGAYALVNVRTTSRQWEQTVQTGAQRSSDLILSSTRYSMLLNRKEDVHETIRAIAASRGVENVRVYDKQGMIIFSALEEEIGQQVDLQAEACVSCHAQDEPLASVPLPNRARLFERPDNGRILGLITPIQNAPDCSNAACHAHPPGQSVLGVLDVTMSMHEPDARLATLEKQSVVAAVVLALVAGVFSATFVMVVVRRPVKRLIAGVERVAGGDLETELDVESRGEIGALASSFNAMTRDLRAARAELTEWSDRLEVNLRQKTDELSRTQRQVAHMDKMASLGKLAATVAHELNNPLAGILNYAKLVERTLADEAFSEEERPELLRFIGFIQREASRSGDIVRNLLAFARPSGAQFALHSLGEILERAVMLVRHHMEIAGIRLQCRRLEGDDQLVCDADQLQQALVALLVNAVEAMPSGGTLTVSAEGDAQRVHVTVEDTGGGIPEEALAHIFEPFFSTKEEVGGVGLGLAVVYGIVQRHGGEIDVDSRPGRGTRFHLSLPRAQPQTPSATAPEGAPRSKEPVHG